MTELIKEEFIFLDLDVQNRNEAIEVIANAMDADGRLNNKTGYLQDLEDRESISSTAIGFGFAAPHAKSNNIAKPALGFAHFANPIIWDEKGSSVEVFFQIGMPHDASPDELGIIANLFRSIIDEDFRTNVLNATSPQEIINIINQLRIQN